MPDAVNYELIIIGQDANGSYSFFDQNVGNNTSYSVSGFLDIGVRYSWYVIAFYQDGSSSSAFSLIDFVNGPSDFPGIPSLSWPQNGENYAGVDLSLTWNRAERATSYVIQVAKDSAFTLNSVEKLIESLNSPVGAHFQFPDIGDTYYWRVAAANSLGMGPYSTPRSFVNGPSSIPDIPTAISPIDANVSGPEVPLSWSSVARATSYYLEISLSKFFSGDIFFSGPVGSTNYTVTNLPDNGATYYWRVKAVNDLGSSNFTESVSFINGPTWSPSSQPVILSPKAGINVADSKCAFAWSKVDYTKTYIVYLSAVKWTPLSRQYRVELSRCAAVLYVFQ